MHALWYLELVEIQSAVLVHVENFKCLTNLGLLLVSELIPSRAASKCCSRHSSRLLLWPGSIKGAGWLCVAVIGVHLCEGWLCVVGILFNLMCRGEIGAKMLSLPEQAHDQQVQMICDFLRGRNSHWTRLCAYLETCKFDSVKCEQKRSILAKYSGVSDIEELQRKHFECKSSQKQKYRQRIEELRRERDELLTVYKERKQRHFKAIAEAKRIAVYKHLSETRSSTIKHIQETLEASLLVVNKNKTLTLSDYIAFKQAIQGSVTDNLLEIYRVDGVQQLCMQMLINLRDRPIEIDIYKDGQEMVAKFKHLYGRSPISLQRAILDRLLGRESASVDQCTDFAVVPIYKSDLRKINELMNHLEYRPLDESIRVDYSNQVQQMMDSIKDFNQRIDSLISEATLFPFLATPKECPPCRVPRVDQEYFKLQAMRTLASSVTMPVIDSDESRADDIEQALVKLHDQVEISKQYQSLLIQVCQFPIYKLHRINESI